MAWKFGMRDTEGMKADLCQWCGHHHPAAAGCMSDTPRVDALVQIIDGGHEYAPMKELLTLARQLERALGEALRSCDELAAKIWELKGTALRVPLGDKLCATPRTDAAIWDYAKSMGEFVPADLSRQIERELQEMQREALQGFMDGMKFGRRGYTSLEELIEAYEAEPSRREELNKARAWIKKMMQDNAAPQAPEKTGN